MTIIPSFIVKVLRQFVSLTLLLAPQVPGHLELTCIYPFKKYQWYFIHTLHTFNSWLNNMIQSTHAFGEDHMGISAISAPTSQRTLV